MQDLIPKSFTKPLVAGRVRDGWFELSRFEANQKIHAHEGADKFYFVLEGVVDSQLET